MAEAFHFEVATSTRHELERFTALHAVTLQAGIPDQSVSPSGRVHAWRKALREPVPPPLAVLRIRKLD